jgi:DNA-binding transcriptional LysR family regulator
MNFHQLKSFYYAVKYGSFSAAADALYITQPAVTKQIQQLQAAYGVKLLNRFGKKMVPTDAGEVLYDFADKIFQFESQAEESLRDFQQRKSGRLRIHASESFGAYYLPSVINLFRKKYPKVRISVNIFPNQEIVENTVKLENDMGFISYPIEHKKLLAQEILEDRLVLIVPPTHLFARKKSLEPRQLDGQSIVMHERGSASREIVDGFIKRHNISVSIPLELSNNEAIKRAVEEGIGLSLISENVVKEEVKRKKLKSIPLMDPALTRKFYLIYHREKYLSQPFQMFINMVNQWASEFNRELSP